MKLDCVILTAFNQAGEFYSLANSYVYHGWWVTSNGSRPICGGEGGATKNTQINEIFGDILVFKRCLMFKNNDTDFRKS